MARYRKIDPRIWNDEKVNDLSLRAKLIFLFVLTHPSQTFLGAFRATREGLAVELGIPTEGFEEGFAKPFDELLVKGLLMYSQKVKTIYAPNFLKYNFPDNPNQVRGFDVALDFIPEGDLFRFVLWNTARIIHENQKDSLIKALPIPFAEQYAEGLPEGFTEPFRKGLPKLRAKNQELRTNKEITPVAPLTDQLIEPPSHPEEQTVSTEKKVRATRTPIATTKKPDDLSEQTWNDWVVQRRAKRAAITETVIAEFRSQAEKAGITLEEAVKCSLLRDWRGFKAAWYLKDQNQAARSNYETAEERRMRELNESAASTIRMPSAWIEAEDGTLKAIYEEEERYAAEG